MATLIRPELSERNKYWISKHRHYELKHFCLQYPEWKMRYYELATLSKREFRAAPSRTGNHSDPIFRIVEKRDFYSRRIRMLEQTAMEADPDLAKYLLKAVTESLSYNQLKTRLDIPCGRDMYYDRYRKFFWILDKKRDSLN